MAIKIWFDCSLRVASHSMVVSVHGIGILKKNNNPTYIAAENGRPRFCVRHRELVCSANKRSFGQQLPVPFPPYTCMLGSAEPTCILHVERGEAFMQFIWPI